MTTEPMPSEVAQGLQREFGYVPDESAGERWMVFRNHSLIVIHWKRKPRIYRRHCGGVYYEFEPVWP